MKKLFKIFTLLAVALALSFKPVGDKKVIVIDAAHGGRDTGASIEDYTEKEIVEHIAKKLKALNKDEEVEIILLRDSDEFIPLADRAERINELSPDLFISLHVNSSKDKTSRGNEIFISPQNKFYRQSLDFALNFNQNFTAGNMKNRLQHADFFILKNSDAPSVLLYLGYLSNDEDRNFLLSEDGQTEIAKKLLALLK